MTFKIVNIPLLNMFFSYFFSFQYSLFIYLFERIHTSSNVADQALQGCDFFLGNSTPLLMFGKKKVFYSTVNMSIAFWAQIFLFLV